MLTLLQLWNGRLMLLPPAHTQVSVIQLLHKSSAYFTRLLAPGLRKQQTGQHSNSLQLHIRLQGLETLMFRQ